MRNSYTSKIIKLDKIYSDELFISVICPMYNESQKIKENLINLFDALKQLPYPSELIIVNDGSTDNSLQEAESCLETYDDFTIVTYNFNRGRGYAIRQGITAAKGNIIVVTESDLSYGMKIIQRMITPIIENNLDVVVASPHAQGGKMENVPFVRSFYTVAGNRLLRLLMPVKLTTYTGMTRAYRGDIIKTLDMESDGKELHLEIISKLSALDCRIGEIPASLFWEPSRKKRKVSFNAKRYILSHLTFGLGESPLLVLALISFFFIIMGAGCGLYLLFLSLTGIPVSGRPLIHFSMLSVIVGFFMLVFGFLAQQNKRLERQLYRLQSEMIKPNSTKRKKNSE